MQKTRNDVAFLSIHVLYITPFLKLAIQLEKLFWGAENGITVRVLNT